MEDIVDIKDMIKEIKKKIRNNPNFLSPVNKERLEYQEKLKFANGNEFTCWMQQNGIMKKPTDIHRDRRENKAKNEGFKNDAERQREINWDNGKNSPMCDNIECSSWLGKHIGEKLLFKRFLEENIFERVEWIGGEKDRGIDFKCINPRLEFMDKYPQHKLGRDKEYKIQLKMRCLYEHDNRVLWNFPIRHNNTIDYFILCGLDNREDLNPILLLMIHKNEMIRKWKGAKEDIFWKRESFTITNNPYYIAKSRLYKYELKGELERLKLISKKIKYNSSLIGV